MRGTRQALVEAATRTFADDGVFTASLVEVTRRAGQRNRGAVHYHFGGRDGLLVAVLEQYADFLAVRQGELLERARAAGAGDLAAVIEAIVRPAAELAETGPAGRDYLVIVGELVEDYERVGEDVEAALARTGGNAVYELLQERMPPLDEALRTERLTLITSFILRSIADRAKHPGSRGQLPTERFVRNLVAMAAGLATASAVDV